MRWIVMNIADITAENVAKAIGGTVERNGSTPAL
jgi:hypothetical protein